LGFEIFGGCLLDEGVFGVATHGLVIGEWL
jgi:hypothetical protein